MSKDMYGILTAIEFFILGAIFTRVFLNTKAENLKQKFYNKGFDQGVQSSADGLKHAEAKLMASPGGYVIVKVMYPVVEND